MQGLFIELFLECDRKEDVRVGPERVQEQNLAGHQKEQKTKGNFYRIGSDE